MINVAGRAELLSDDHPVGLAGPAFGPAGREPIAGLGHQGFAEGSAFGEVLQEAGEAIGRAQDVGMAMGEGDVGFDRLPVVACGESGEKRGDAGKTTDVFIRDPALENVLAGGVAIEERTMVFLEVGIAMPARGEHEINVMANPAFGLVVAVLLDLFVKSRGELEVCRVFTGPEVLVIVNVLLAPETGLVVEDVRFFVAGCELGTPQNAVGVMRQGGPKVAKIGVITVERFSIVIPMDRHGEGVGKEGAVKSGFVGCHGERLPKSVICRGDF